MKNNIIYVGFLYTDSVLKKLSDLGSAIDFPGYNFQRALISGLDNYYPNLKIVTTSYMSSYPGIKKILFAPEYFSHNKDNKHKDLFVGLVNLPIIKNISKFIRIRNGIKKQLNATNNTVIVYELHTPFLLAIASLRKNIDHVCVIVPDLPEYMTEKKDPLYLFLKRIDRLIIHKIIKKFSSFILFSKHMQEKLPIKNKPSAVLEGIYLPTEIQNVPKLKEKTILYSGNLSHRSGIIDLIQAFKMIKDENYQLWIRGDGSPEIIKEIEMLSDNDTRIKRIPRLSREKLVELQKSATILVNPTKASYKYTRYFFPSKTMEYMASGTPTLMYKLDCLPSDYYPYLFFIPDESITSLYNSIIELCEKPQMELNQFGNRAAKFIENNKVPVKQAKIVYDIIESCLSGKI